MSKALKKSVKITSTWQLSSKQSKIIEESKILLVIVLFPLQNLCYCGMKIWFNVGHKLLKTKDSQILAMLGDIEINL